MDAPTRAQGPMNRILSSSLPLIFVIPGPSSQNHSIYFEMATIVANNIFSYLRIDSELALDTHMVKRSKEGRIGVNNLVILGGTENAFGNMIFSKSKSEVQWLSDRQGWSLQERIFDEQGLGMPSRRFLQSSHSRDTTQASHSCINTRRRPLPWRCLYLQHLLTVLIESCVCFLFVLESRCQNGL